MDPKESSTNYWIEYGTTSEYGHTTTSMIVANTTAEQSETAALSELTPCTTYHYQAEAENEASEGSPSLGGDQTFTTSCAGIITHFAGDNHYERSGDGEKAIEAGLDGVSGLTTGADGNIYIAESGLNNIRRVDSEGTIHRVAGVVGDDPGYEGDGDSAATAHLGKPFSLATSTDGTVYIAEDWNQVVRAFSPGGEISTFAGKRPEINRESWCNSTDRLYSGDGGPANEAGFGDSLTLDVGPDGSLYIADRNDAVVRKVDPEGNITTVAGYFDSEALKVHKVYNLFDPSELLCEYTSYEPEKPSYSGDGGSATSATLGEPASVAVGSDGSIYIADPFDSVIRRVESDGTISTFAGTGKAGYSGDGGLATEAELADPTGLATGPEGSVFVAEGCGDVVRRIASDGTITTVAGTGESGETGDGGSATSAKLHTPDLISVDSEGNLYIDDNGLNVRKVGAPLGPGATDDKGDGTCGSEGGGGIS